MRKYYIWVSIIFLFLVPWLIGSTLDWMVWIPAIFLGLIYIPGSYELAIDRGSVLKGILFPIKVIFLLLLIFFMLAVIVGLVGNFLILPMIFDQEGPITFALLHFFKAFEQSPFSFLLWNFASFNALIYLLSVLEDREEKKTVDEKEDSEPNVEE